MSSKEFNTQNLICVQNVRNATKFAPKGESLHPHSFHPAGKFAPGSGPCAGVATGSALFGCALCVGSVLGLGRWSGIPAFVAPLCARFVRHTWSGRGHFRPSLPGGLLPLNP